MIIGNGDIAKALPVRDDLLFFASGVSNSRETNEDAYRREEQLLMQQDKKKHLVYFSSLCVFYSDTRYAKHKKLMEDTIRMYWEHYTIIRIGNIDFGENPNTIINFLRNQYKKGEKLDIQDTFRYIVSKEELLYWIGMIPKWNVEMNITGKKMKVQEIVDEYVIPKK